MDNSSLIGLELVVLRTTANQLDCYMRKRVK
jgi:hypothetical protein